MKLTTIVLMLCCVAGIATNFKADGRSFFLVVNSFALGLWVAVAAWEHASKARGEK